VETTNINDVLEYLDFQLHIKLKRAKSEGYKFLIVSLAPQVEDGIADVKLRTRPANTYDELRDIIDEWGYDLDTVTQNQVQIYRLESIE
jgi:hypothetical protein